MPIYMHFGKIHAAMRQPPKLPTEAPTCRASVSEWDAIVSDSFLPENLKPEYLRIVAARSDRLFG